eukprot:SAG31_NODE_1262_length_9072_cov_11.697760_3_plen_186_part_00
MHKQHVRWQFACDFDIVGACIEFWVLAANRYVPGLQSEFVTAMVKGGTDGFSIKGAAADRKGALQLIYDGPRPAGYTPMHKSGAIILGVGGDNMLGVASGHHRQHAKPARHKNPQSFGSSSVNLPPYPGEAESIGTFYEGVLTIGYSTDAADAEVHANILAAGYGTAGYGRWKAPVDLASQKVHT